MKRLSRRSLIGGLAAIPATAGTGRAFAAQEAPDVVLAQPGAPAAIHETPNQKVDRLIAELAVAINEKFAGGRSA